jgi:hypothetical protein
MSNLPLQPAVPLPPYPERPRLGSDVGANQRAMVGYRRRRALADYQIGREVGGFPISDDWLQVVARIYSAYVIADAQG